MSAGPRDVLLVKWGGSLITDKRTPESARDAEIRRLADELAAGLSAARDRGLAVLLGHGSGSFGHVAAARHGLAGGLRGGDLAQLAGVTETQGRAAALHRLVLDALAAAGVAAFSTAPSSFLVADDGEPAACCAEPVARALAAGLVPVVYGDVVTDRRRGVAIASTERVFTGLAAALPAHGWRVVEALWLGDTPGVWDENGQVVTSLSPTDAARLTPGAAEGTDVTGGMAHRLDTARRLAASGVTSTIADGRVAGLFRDFLAGGTAPGTRVSAD